MTSADLLLWERSYCVFPPQVKVWNTNSGLCFVTFTEHTSSVSNVTFTSSGFVIVSASLDGTVRAFDLHRWFIEKRWRLSSHGEYQCAWAWTVCVSFCWLQVQKLQDVHLTPAGAVLLPGSRCQRRAGERWSSGLLWDLPVVHADGPTAGGRIRTTFISSKNMRIAPEKYDKNVLLPVIHQVLGGHEGPVSCLCFSPVQSILASASWDRTVRLWDMLDSWQVKETLPLSSDGKRRSLTNLFVDITWHYWNDFNYGGLRN